MPTREAVEGFVAAVQDGRYVEAIETYYVEDATMQENQAPPRGGRNALVSHETAVLAGLKTMKTAKVGEVLIDGDHVVINWVFEMTLPGGVVRRMDELALQTWRGDRIASERFYYDPAQLTAAPADL